MIKIVLALLFTLNSFGEGDYSICKNLSAIYKDKVQNCLKMKDVPSNKKCLKDLGQSAHKKYPQCAKIIIDAYQKWVDKGVLPPGM
jgi:hypothetical protein